MMKRVVLAALILTALLFAACAQPSAEPSRESSAPDFAEFVAYSRIADEGGNIFLLSVNGPGVELREDTPIENFAKVATFTATWFEFRAEVREGLAIESYQLTTEEAGKTKLIIGKKFAGDKAVYERCDELAPGIYWLNIVVSGDTVFVPIRIKSAGTAV